MKKSKALEILKNYKESFETNSHENNKYLVSSFMEFLKNILPSDSLFLKNIEQIQNTGVSIFYQSNNKIEEKVEENESKFIKIIESIILYVSNVGVYQKPQKNILSHLNNQKLISIFIGVIIFIIPATYKVTCIIYNTEKVLLVNENKKLKEENLKLLRLPKKTPKDYNNFNSNKTK